MEGHIALALVDTRAPVESLVALLSVVQAEDTTRRAIGKLTKELVQVSVGTQRRHASAVTATSRHGGDAGDARTGSCGCCRS